MPTALLLLLGSQLIGEVLRQLLHVPLPGPVIGMFLLALVLIFGWRGTKPAQDGNSHALVKASNTLIHNMGLLFVPAGVGLISQADLLRAHWLSIVLGLVISTLLGLVVTGLLMHGGLRRVGPHVDAADTTGPQA